MAPHSPVSRSNDIGDPDPSALLERRPDVAEAERRVAAANAQIGIARAAYFPQFTLSGDAGFNSVHAGNWIAAPSRFWSIGPQLTMPLFEGGRLVGQTERAKAQYEEQVADYRNAVLTAYQDVEDSLAALRQLEWEAQTVSAAVTAAGVACSRRTTAIGRAPLPTLRSRAQRRQRSRRSFRRPISRRAASMPA
jgi:outer membrane protein TolC